MPIENITSPVDKKLLLNISKENSKKRTDAATKPYPNDSVEFSTKEPPKKKKLWKSIGIAIGAAAATLAVTAILFAKHQNNKISKLYKDKLVLSNLAENIEFKEAKTIEDAIKFTKETLGIKDIDKNFTLEALNTANKGLVEVSNANKGKLFMPPALRFEAPVNESNEYIAYVVRDINSKNFGNLVMNKNYFDASFLDKEIKELIYAKNGEKMFTFNKNIETQTSKYFMGNSYVVPNNDLAKLIDAFYKDSSKVSVSDKQKIYYSFLEGYNKSTRSLRSPIEALEKLQKEDGDFLKQNNITINIEELSKLKTEKQKEFLEKIFKKMSQNRQYKYTEYPVISPTSTVHHELGHLQDFAKNLKELDLKEWEIGTKKFWNKLWQDAKNGIKKEDRIGVNEVNNRWGSIEKDKYKKLFEKEPEKFKKQYPDLYEFLTNQEKQQTAGKVSEYAQSGIGEFVAETYKKMISKEKLPEDVLALYKKYNGPTLAA